MGELAFRALQYSAHPLIRMPHNSNFRYFEQISKYLEFELRKFNILCCLIRTSIIQKFAYSNNFLGP